MIANMSKNNQAGILFHSELEHLMMEIGNTDNVFTLDYEEWSFLATPTWMTSTWSFCSKYNICLAGPLVNISTQREGDVLLMKKFLSIREHFTQEDLILINQCRMYMKVMFLSDIASGDGRFIEETFISGECPIDRRSKWNWPFQNKPSEDAWVLWRKALNLAWNVDAAYRQCRPSLGKWIENKYDNMLWLYWYDPETNRVFKKAGMVWTIYKFIMASRTFSIFESSGSTRSPPININRVSVTHCNGNRIFTSGNAPLQPKYSLDVPHDVSWWQRQLLLSNKYVQLLLTNTMIYRNGELVKEAIKQKSLNIVCDGSYFATDSTAAAAFIIETACKVELGRGYCRVTGEIRELCPYRAELGGIHLVLNVIQVLCDKLSISKGAINLYCDCEAAIKILHRHPETIKVTTKQHDLLWDILSLLRSIPICVNLIWVKGHQSTRNIQSDQLARMNDAVDAVAKQYARFCIQHPGEQRELQYGIRFWHVRCEEMKIVNSIDKAIIHHIHAKELFAHLMEKYDLSYEEIQTIDWQAMSKAMTNLTLSERLWATKHVSHFNGLGIKMYQYNQWDSPLCPRCGKKSEDMIHLVTCTHDSCDLIRSEALLRFSNTLDKWNTAPMIRFLFLRKLQQPDKFFLDFIPSNSPDSLIAAAKEQDIYGLGRFLEGRLTSKWRHLQDVHHKENCPETKKTGVLWSAMVIRNILRYCKEHWKIRNQYLSDENIRKSQENIRNKILNEVIDELGKGICGISTDMQFLFEMDIDRMKQLSMEAQRSWLEYVYSARNFCGERTSQEVRDMHRFMERWRRPRRGRRNRTPARMAT